MTLGQAAAGVLNCTSRNPAPPPLLDLPESCLQGVLQYCASDDVITLFSAARCHSRLHKIAVTLSSIVWRHPTQQQLGGMLSYFDKYGHHVRSLTVGSWRHTVLTTLPSSLSNLTSLEFNSAGSSRADRHLHLQLLQGDGPKGVLAAVKHSLKRLRLHGCVVRGGNEALHQALYLLPGLQHLSIWKPLTARNDNEAGIRCQFYAGSPGTLRRLLQLTSLEVGDCELKDPTRDGLQHLTGLTRLQELRLAFTGAMVAATGLSTLQLLTRLEIGAPFGCLFDPAMLVGLSQLQHLELQDASISKTASVAQLLSGLQDMQQLTLLNLARCTKFHDGIPHATAFAALTASSMLQYLNISEWRLPTTAWLRMFPIGKQLPYMRTIVAKGVMRSDGIGQGSCPAEAPESRLLVSCCPGLASIQLRGLFYRPVQMAQLQGLTGLRELHLLEPADDTLTEDVLKDVCTLTRLRELRLGTGDRMWDKLLQLTQLHKLTLLRYGDERHQPATPPIEFRQDDAHSNPVDHQLWQHVFHQQYPWMAQYAAATPAAGVVYSGNGALI